jgi:hypothetical protein
VAVAIDDDLRHVRVGQFGRIGDAPPQRAHRQRGVVRERRHRLIDHARLDQRLVALNVDDEIAVERGRDFGEPIGAARVRRRRQPDGAAKPLDRPHDALVVGCDDHRGQRARRRRAAIHVLDHRPSVDVGERFSGETRRLIPCGDDGDCGELNGICCGPRG